MTKAEQMSINAQVEIVEHRFRMDALDVHKPIESIKRLRNCQAWVYKVGNVYALRSYNTFIAVVDEDGDTYDFLRRVYGYTSTSAQHIAKFRNDYGRTGRTYTWRDIGVGNAYDFPPVD